MLIFHGSRKENKIALTFDDGPNPYGIPKVLDILDKHKEKATFFLIGKWVKLYPDIVKQINRRGHLIGNHSYNHFRYKRDLKQSANEIYKITKKFPTYIRPPYGNLLPYLPEMFSNRSQIVMWDVLPYDWKMARQEIFNNVINKVKNGSIIVLHDGSHREGQEKRCKEMLASLSEMIKILKEKYELVRIDKMKF